MRQHFDLTYHLIYSKSSESLNDGWQGSVDPVDDGAVPPEVLALDVSIGREQGSKERGSSSLLRRQMPLVAAHVSVHVTRMNIIDHQILEIEHEMQIRILSTPDNSISCYQNDQAASKNVAHFKSNHAPFTKVRSKPLIHGIEFCSHLPRV